MRVWIRRDGSKVVTHGLDKAWVPEPTVSAELVQAAEEFTGEYWVDRVDDIVRVFGVEPWVAVGIYKELNQYKDEEEEAYYESLVWEDVDSNDICSHFYAA